MATQSALVLFSGGQDSATCLAWALQRFDLVETVGFDYGQRHAIEMQVRDAFRRELIKTFPHWSGKLGSDHLLDATVIKQLGATAMTDDVKIALDADGLPNTFVPGRNLLFFTLAGALACRRSIHNLVGGMYQLQADT